jgi:hypothetical protein
MGGSSSSNRPSKPFSGPFVPLLSMHVTTTPERLASTPSSSEKGGRHHVRDSVLDRAVDRSHDYIQGRLVMDARHRARDQITSCVSSGSRVSTAVPRLEHGGVLRSGLLAGRGTCLSGAKVWFWALLMYRYMLALRVDLSGFLISGPEVESPCR